MSEFSSVLLKNVNLIHSNGNKISLIDEQSASQILKSFIINEDMFSAGVHGSLVFRDTGTLGRDLPLVGGEILQIELQSQGPDSEDSDIVEYRFFISKVTPLSDEAANEVGQTTVPTYWSIEFTGYENIYYNYTEPVIFEDGDDIIKKIATRSDDEDDIGLVNSLAEKYFDPRDETNSKEKMYIEPTANTVWLKKNTNLYPFRKPVQQVPVIKLMNYLAENSVPEANINAANYMFWQDLDKWNFRSIESLVSEPTAEGEVESQGSEAGGVYTVDTQPSQDSKYNFQDFTVTSEFSPLLFLDSGGFLSEYLRVDPDYSNTFLDFTTFNESHKSEVIKYSYNEEFDKVSHVENYKLVGENFDFEPDIPVRKYDNVHGYFSESYYNDPMVRLRHNQTDLSQIYKKDLNHLGNTAAYNEDYMWQAMFDQTDLRGDVIKKIVEIKKELAEKREELGRKRDLKEKWAAYRCSTCCLIGYDDGSTGPCQEEENYKIVAAGSFSDVVNFDPEDERANENGLLPAYDFENDPDLQRDMEDLFKLRRPDNIEAILFSIDAQIYGVQQAAQIIRETVDFCSGGINPPQYSQWTGPEESLARTQYSGPYGSAGISGRFNDGLYYGGWFDYNSYFYYSGWYGWWNGYYNLYYGGGSVNQHIGPLGYGYGDKYPCSGCYYWKSEVTDQSVPYDRLSYFDFPGSAKIPTFTLVVDTSRPQCILNRAGYMETYYGNLYELLIQYKETLLSAYETWIKRSIFKKAKQEYLDVPGNLPLSFQNIKSIKRKKIRGSRYEVFAMKRALVDDVQDSYEYLVNYGNFAGRFENTSGEETTIDYVSGEKHPYYDQEINTSFGEFATGEMSYTPIDGVQDGLISTENFVVPSGWHENNTSSPRSLSWPSEEGDVGRIAIPLNRYFVRGGQSFFTYQNNFGAIGFYDRELGRSLGVDLNWWYGDGNYSYGSLVMQREAIQASSSELELIGVNPEQFQRRFNYDGQIQHFLVGYSGLLSYVNPSRYGGIMSFYDPNTFDYCNVYDCVDADNIIRLYQNISNWYTPSENYQSPVRFLQENQHYIRIEFNEPVGLETLRDFPYGFIRDAGTEYYVPYLVSVTPGPLGRQAPSFNIAVIGMDPYGFDIAATRTDMNTMNFSSERSPGGTVRSSFFPADYLDTDAYNDYITTWYRVPSRFGKILNHRYFGKAPKISQAPEDDWYNLNKFNIPPNFYTLYDDYEVTLLRTGQLDSFLASRDPGWYDWNNRGQEAEIYGADQLDPELLEQVTDVENDYLLNGAITAQSLSLTFEQYLGPTWETYGYKFWNTPNRGDSDDEIWQYDISGESEYGVMTPNVSLDGAGERSDYYHELVRNFSGTFVVHARRNPQCSKYECANPDAPVFAPKRPNNEEDLALWDPYIDCPAQYLRPDAEVGEDGEISFTTENNEPSCDELRDLESSINECSLIEEKLGAEYLGCLFSNPKAVNSCNCPEQGEKYKEYLEHTRTYATFWDTPKETPLRRDAQMIQFGYQQATGRLQGDFNLKPGNLIYVEIDPGANSRYPIKRSGGSWMVTGLQHIITEQNHIMNVKCRRDSIPTDLDKPPEEPIEAG